MIRLAEYEKQQGAEDLKIRRYVCRDYIVVQLIRTFVLATIGFVLLMALAGIGNMTLLMDKINQMDLKAALILIIVVYVVFMLISLIFTFGVALNRYNEAGESVREYEHQIKRLEKLYRRQQNGDV